MLNNMMGAWPAFAFTAWGGAARGVPTLPGTHQKAGKFIAGYFQSGYRSMRYKLYIPSSYCGEPLPLVVMLHGCSQNADDFALGTGMNALAERFDCLVLYPEQSSDANWNRCWNWFEAAHHQRGYGEPALIAGLAQKIMAEYAVDEARVSVAGLSCGGAMAVILGRTYSDLFSAVGCHSGLAHGSATDGYGAMLAMRDGSGRSTLAGMLTTSSVPIIVFHGDADSTVHHRNSTAVVRQSVDNYLAQFPPGKGELVISEESGEIRGRGFTRSVHRGKEGEVVAEQWMVHGTAHAWSGGNKQGSYTDMHGPDASEEMLQFFINR